MRTRRCEFKIVFFGSHTDRSHSRLDFCYDKNLQRRRKRRMFDCGVHECVTFVSKTSYHTAKQVSQQRTNQPTSRYSILDTINPPLKTNSTCVIKCREEVSYGRLTGMNVSGYSYAKSSVCGAYNTYCLYFRKDTKC